jgi:acyl-coenzyme A thioesterase PaaI-like protein
VPDQEPRTIDPGSEWTAIEDDGFVGLAGPFYYKETDAGLAFRFPVIDKHRNRNGRLQGGALLTFADRALGTAARAAIEASSTVTVQLNIQFVAGVRIGETVEVVPTVIRATRSLVFMEGTFMVGDRRVAAINGIWKRIAEVPRATGAVSGSGQGRFT